KHRPECASSRINLAMHVAQSGRPAEAEPHLRRALDLLVQPGADTLLRGAHYVPGRYGAFGVEYERIEIAHVHGSEGWCRDMAALLRWQALELLSDVAFASERFNEAAGHASGAAAIMPYLADTRYRLGMAHNALGCLDRAIAEYRAALEVNPFLAAAREALVCALVDAGAPADALAVADEWGDIVAGCPVYGDSRHERQRLRAPAERALSDATAVVPDQRRLLAFTNWDEVSDWTEIVARFAGAEPRDTLLMLWADPERYDAVRLLRQVADCLTTRLRIPPHSFPNVTVVSHRFAPHERWRLFHAATHILDPARVPEQFLAAFEANRLPSISLTEPECLAA
ncbi:MAG TPA: hypothetical protein VKT77_21900, partial [Chthonomonadaceae bacterium]|nr:hypothetical protein [Chthonomonadaceae bacterium]